MYLTKIENVSDTNVTLKQSSGTTFMLTPGNSVKHVEVANLHEVLAKVKVSHDLTEVINRESHSKVLYG